MKTYLTTLFGLTAALVYGPFVRKWLMFNGISNDSSSVWASIAGVIVAAAALWLIARVYEQHRIKLFKEEPEYFAQTSSSSPSLTSSSSPYSNEDIERRIELARGVLEQSRRNRRGY